MSCCESSDHPAMSLHEAFACAMIQLQPVFAKTKYFAPEAPG